MIIQQNTEEWSMERAGKLTGSAFVDVMPGKSGKYLKSRDDLLDKLLAENLAGIPIESISSKATDWGDTYEDEAAEVFSQRTGYELEECGFYQSDIHELLGVSTDRLIKNTRKAIEIKCPFNMTNHINYRRKGMPDKYRDQVQGNIWVRDLEGMYFVSYDPRMPEPINLYFKYYERNDEYIDKLKAESFSFLEELQEAIHNEKQEIEKWAK